MKKKLYKATFYMKSGNVIEFECDHFSLTKGPGGTISKWEAEGVAVQCMSIVLDCVEAIVVVDND